MMAARRSVPDSCTAREMTRVIRECGVPEEQETLFLGFALELSVMLHHLPVPDFTQRAEWLLRRYMRDGLSGPMLREVGYAVIGERFKGTGSGC